MQPARLKHPKVHRGSLKAKATRGTYLSFGSFGLKAEESRWIKANQLEAARRVMTRFVSRGGKIWMRVFPDKPVTKKPPEVTLGGGKGQVDHYVAPIKPGRVLFEMDGVSRDAAVEALRLAAHKLPVKTRFVTKD